MADNPTGTASGKTSAGDQAEDAALKFLKRQGLKPLERNYRCRRGEIDLIMRDAEWIVFVEVRFRRQGSTVSALESVSHGKQNRIRATALHYLQSKRINPDATPLRFDVIAMSGSAPSFETNWIKSALD
ncbi:MAG: YraN family protein [Gammaproteobacteria bacterium]